MEAVPKLPLISFELKTSPENTHFGPKLKQYIGEAYREDPDSYSNEIHQLEGLRSAAVRPSNDASGLSALLRYFCQLRAIQSRFPMAKGQPVACSFAWKDLYANMSCSLADIRFELACILYNIGALHTQLASSEPRTSADSLKAACTKYQNAAWAFQYLREQYPQPPGVDVSTDIMRLFQEICFAQAQECILDKSIQDTKKPSVVGAVATQVLFFYRNSLALLGPSTGTDNIHEIIGTKLYNYWYRYLSFKTAYIGCIVCLYQGMHAEEQQKMGERVAYYQQAAEKLNDARKLAKYIEPTQITQEALNFTNDVVEGKKKAAKNENEFIYHEEVPDKDLLVDLKPVCLVKAIPINLNDPEISGPDIFSRLVPMGAHEASSLYSEEKAKLLRHVVTQVEVKNTELMEFMSSLQLEQLDVLDSDQKIPQEIVDRCAAMHAKTEIIQMLVDSMNNLAEIISDVEHSLADIKNLIQEETVKEKEYQKVMGPRPPSIVQTELSREFHKYQEAHARTNESNQVLHKAMTLHIANLRLLSQPLEVLQAKIPSIDNIEGLDRSTMSELRRVVGKAREMQTQRDVLVQQLRDSVTSDDITGKLLASSEPADELFRRELEKHTPKDYRIPDWSLSPEQTPIYNGGYRQPPMQRMHGGRRNATACHHGMQECGRPTGTTSPVTRIVSGSLQQSIKAAFLLDRYRLAGLINVPTAGAQAFPMDGIGRLGHDPPRGPSADWRVLTTADATGTNGLTCLPKHGGARDSKFLVTHPMTDHCESYLTSTIAAERANHLRHRAPVKSRREDSWYSSSICHTSHPHPAGLHVASSRLF
ncbi:hypothetical protein evm_009167 [Chilo suppressalis]|nr:hypothetical protein evm_009167 [Chilo suppressalis]